MFKATFNDHTKNKRTFKDFRTAADLADYLYSSHCNDTMSIQVFTGHLDMRKQRGESVELFARHFNY